MSEVIGISKEDYDPQVNSIRYFFEEVKNKLNSLQQNWNKFLFLDSFKLRNPEVLVLRKQPKEEVVVEKTSLPQEDKLNYSGGIGLDGDRSIKLGGRRALYKDRIVQDCNEAGIIVVTVEVGQDGRVLSAIPGTEGSTSSKECLFQPAMRAALNTRFNPDTNAPQKQKGTITYNFKLSE